MRTLASALIVLLTLNGPLLAQTTNTTPNKPTGKSDTTPRGRLKTKVPHHHMHHRGPSHQM